MPRASCNNQNFHLHSVRGTPCPHKGWLQKSTSNSPLFLTSFSLANCCIWCCQSKVLEGRVRRRPRGSYLADTEVRWHWAFKSGSSCHQLFVSFFTEPHWEFRISLPKVWVTWVLRDAFSSAWLFPHQPLIGLPQLGLPCPSRQSSSSIFSQVPGWLLLTWPTFMNPWPCKQ